LTVLYIRGFGSFVTSTTAPIATGWSESCRVGIAPTEDRRLVTAHNGDRRGVLPSQSPFFWSQRPTKRKRPKVKAFARARPQFFFRHAVADLPARSHGRAGGPS